MHSILIFNVFVLYIRYIEVGKKECWKATYIDFGLIRIVLNIEHLYLTLYYILPKYITPSYNFLLFIILFSYIKKTKYLCSRTIYGDTLFIDLYILQSGIWIKNNNKNIIFVNESNTIVLLLLIACAGNPLVCLARREVTTHKINLDISPQERYNKLIPHFNETVWGFYNKYFANDKILTGVLYGLVDARGPENAEQQGEIEGLGTQSGLPLKFVRGVQFLYELSTLMVPIKNLTRIATNTVVSGNQQYGMDYIHKPWRPSNYPR